MFSHETKLKNLESFLIKQNINVVAPNNHGEYGRGKIVHISDLTKRYPYTNLISFCKDHSTTNTITLEDLLQFFDKDVHTSKKYKGNHSENTIGRYPMIMDIVFSIYNVQLIEENEIYFAINLSQVKKFDREAYDRIYPKRDAFTILYLNSKNIERHFGKYVSMVYEITIDTKSYDSAVLFNKERLHHAFIPEDGSPLIDNYYEVQEGGHLTGNLNDKNKYDLCITFGKSLNYFITKQPDYSSTIYSFMEKSLQSVKEMLIYYSDEFRIDNLLKESKRILKTKNNILRNQINKSIGIKKEVKTDEFNNIERLICNIDNHHDTISKLYTYYTIGNKIERDLLNIEKDISIIAEAKYVIDANFIIKKLKMNIKEPQIYNILDTDSKEISLERELLLTFGIERDISVVKQSLSKYDSSDYNYLESTLFFDFDGFNSIINDYNTIDNEVIRRDNHRILLTVMEVFKYYTDCMSRISSEKTSHRDKLFKNVLNSIELNHKQELSSRKRLYDEHKNLLKEKLLVKDAIIEKIDSKVESILDVLRTFQTIIPALHEFDKIAPTDYLNQTLELLNRMSKANLSEIKKEFPTIVNTLRCANIRLQNSDLTTLVEKSFGIMRVSDSFAQKKIIQSELKKLHQIYSDEKASQDAFHTIIASSIDKIENCTNNIEYFESIAKPKIETLTVQSEQYQSIIKEIEIPLYCSLSLNASISKLEAIAILTSFGITDKKAKEILREYYDLFADGVQFENVSHIKFLTNVKPEIKEVPVEVPVQVLEEIEKEEYDEDALSYHSDSE